MLRAPPSISIQLARRPPTEQGAEHGPQLLIMGTIVPVWRSSQLLSAPLISLVEHLCPAALGSQLGKGAELETR